MISKEIERLIYFFAKIPGFGPKSARRAVLHLVKNQETSLQPLQKALTFAANSVVECQACGNLDSMSPCSICVSEVRQGNKICVVETIADLWAIERSDVFNGKYHILGGALSAIDGITTEDLNLESLINKAENGKIDEVILATNATVEGQTTSNYIISLIKDCPIQISKLAHGIPIGGELDYLDEGTLNEAFESRKIV